MPRLDIHHLSMLVALAETGSVTDAARRLGITQSAVTHRIGEAQRRLGVTLVKRVGRRVFLTPAAERLRTMAARAIGEIERTEQEVMSQHGHARHLVRFGQASYSRYRWLPGFLKKYERELADIEIDLVARATFQPMRMLRDAEVDVVSVCGRKGATGGFEWVHLMRDPLVVIMAPGHPLCERTYLAAKHLREECLIAPANTREPGFEWDGTIGPADLTPRQVKEVQLPEAIIDLVAAGFGVGIIPYWIVEPEVKAGVLAARPLTRAGLWVDWWAVTRAAGTGDPAVRRVVDALVKWCSRSG